jgi:hydrogenase maturation factor
MDELLPVTGRLVALVPDAPGNLGRVSVRGARIDVALDLVPHARVGDSLLVQARVALTVLRDEADEERGSSASWTDREGRG